MVKKTTTIKKTPKPRTPKPAVAAVGDVAETPIEMPPPLAEAEDVDLVKSIGKRELIDRVVEASGIKKKSAKPVVEAMLKELGDALSRGENLNLQPFGKGIVKSHKNLENAEIIEMRLRRSKLAVSAANVAADILAEEIAASGPAIEAAE